MGKRAKQVASGYAPGSGTAQQYPGQAAILNLDEGTINEMVTPQVDQAIVTGRLQEIQDHADVGAYMRDFDRIKDKAHFLSTIGDPDELKKKVPKLGHCKVKTQDEVEEMSKKQKRDTEILIYFLVAVHIVGYVAAFVFAWYVIWGMVTGFWGRLAIIINKVLNGYIVTAPYGVPVVFPFTGTCGLFIGTWLISLVWSSMRIISEKLGGFAGFYYIMDDNMNVRGRFFAAGQTLTGTHMVSDTVMCNVSTPAESINEPRFIAVWKMFKSWFPFYLGNQVRVDKIVIFSTKDMFFPTENYANQHNQILGELYDTGYYYTSGPTIYKIYTCDKVMAWNRIPPGAYPKITYQAMSAYKGVSIQLRIKEKNLQLLFTEIELLLRNKHITDRHFIKLVSDRLTQMGLIDRQTGVIRAKYGGYWDNIGERQKLSSGWKQLYEDRKLLEDAKEKYAPKTRYTGD